MKSGAYVITIFLVLLVVSSSGKPINIEKYKPDTQQQQYWGGKNNDICFYDMGIFRFLDEEKGYVPCNEERCPINGSFEKYIIQEDGSKKLNYGYTMCHECCYTRKQRMKIEVLEKEFEILKNKSAVALSVNRRSPQNPKLQTISKHEKKILILYHIFIALLSTLLLPSICWNVWNCYNNSARNVKSGEQESEAPKNEIPVAIPGKELPNSGEETDESDRDSGVVDVTGEAGDGDVTANSDDANVTRNVNSAGNESGNNTENNGDNGSQRSTTTNANQEAISALVLLANGIDKEESEPLLANDEPPDCIPFVTKGVTVQSKETKI